MDGTLPHTEGTRRGKAGVGESGTMEQATGTIDPFPPYVPNPADWRWKFTRTPREWLYMNDADADLRRGRERAWGSAVGRGEERR